MAKMKQGETCEPEMGFQRKRSGIKWVTEALREEETKGDHLERNNMGQVALTLTLSHKDCSSSCPPKSQNMRRVFPTSTVPTRERREEASS
jgi:hypothetical protein